MTEPELLKLAEDKPELKSAIGAYLVMKAEVNAHFPDFVKGEREIALEFNKEDTLNTGQQEMRDIYCDVIDHFGALAGQAGTFRCVRILKLRDAAEVLDVGYDIDEDLDAFLYEEMSVIVPSDTDHDQEVYVILHTPNS